MTLRASNASILFGSELLAAFKFLIHFRKNYCIIKCVCKKNVFSVTEEAEKFDDCNDEPAKRENCEWQRGVCEYRDTFKMALEHLGFAKVFRRNSLYNLERSACLGGKLLLHEDERVMA